MPKANDEEITLTRGGVTQAGPRYVSKVVDYLKSHGITSARADGLNVKIDSSDFKRADSVFAEFLRLRLDHTPEPQRRTTPIAPVSKYRATDATGKDSMNALRTNPIATRGFLKLFSGIMGRDKSTAKDAEQKVLTNIKTLANENEAKQYVQTMSAKGIAGWADGKRVWAWVTRGQASSGPGQTGGTDAAGLKAVAKFGSRQSMESFINKLKSYGIHAEGTGAEGVVRVNPDDYEEAMHLKQARDSKKPGKDAVSQWERLSTGSQQSREDAKKVVFALIKKGIPSRIGRNDQIYIRPEDRSKINIEFGARAGGSPIAKDSLAPVGLYHSKKKVTAADGVERDPNEAILWQEPTKTTVWYWTGKANQVGRSITEAYRFPSMAAAQSKANALNNQPKEKEERERYGKSLWTAQPAPTRPKVGSFWRDSAVHDAVRTPVGVNPDAAGLTSQVSVSFPTQEIASEVAKQMTAAGVPAKAVQARNGWAVSVSPANRERGAEMAANARTNYATDRRPSLLPYKMRPPAEDGVRRGKIRLRGKWDKYVAGDVNPGGVPSRPKYNPRQPSKRTKDGVNEFTLLATAKSPADAQKFVGVLTAKGISARAGHNGQIYVNPDDSQRALKMWTSGELKPGVPATTTALKKESLRPLNPIAKPGVTKKQTPAAAAAMKNYLKYWAESAGTSVGGPRG